MNASSLEAAPQTRSDLGFNATGYSIIVSPDQVAAVAEPPALVLMLVGLTALVAIRRTATEPVGAFSGG